MRRVLPMVLLCLLAAGLGALAVRYGPRLVHPLPQGVALIEKIREVARLETLEVSLHQTVAFAPDPTPAHSTWGKLVNWARFTLRPPKGKAILFADAHLGLDLRKLDVDHLRVRGDSVTLVLPRVVAQVELRPGETEVIDSSLDSAQTAQLFAVAKDAFQREVEDDPKLQARARDSAKRALTGLLLGLGFRKVSFVARIPGRAQD